MLCCLCIVKMSIANALRQRQHSAGAVGQHHVCMRQKLHIHHEGLQRRQRSTTTAAAAADV